ncbi:aminoglycoside phosphotransferase family protein [Paenibacillus senegalensis]|uniref:aminoglycoside phosphotransferase family protein n=1 Tax=Paenibacillus senegalensis TaxID=1465766 RepID=UPI00028A398F|nr:aminoglycoside phosphotransferase family protein [Paenibacillus senegalensis]
MEQVYQFNKEEIEKITNRFGRAFYQKVLGDLASYAEQWQLSSFQLVPSFSANLVLTCFSESYGNAVFKIGGPSSDISAECSALSEYNGTPFCRVFEADLENQVMLAERICPGTPLRNEASLEKRLAVFCTLYQDLHRSSEQAENYPTYLEWVSKITEYMSKRDDCTELYRYMKRAKELCFSICEKYPRNMLLHGDLHHDNILLGQDGGYRIIDPKGVVGDPVFDVPRFLLNEYGEEITRELYDDMNKMIGVLEKELGIPNEILRQCLYVETAMGVCWSVEDGSSPDEFPKLIEHVKFAESMLN